MLNSQSYNRWDERTPEGLTVAEMIRRKLTSPVLQPQPAPGQQIRYITPDQHGALPQPVDAPTGGTTLPQPIDAPTGGVALARQPEGIQLSTGQETRPSIVGKGPGVGRIQTMIDNPTRQVNPDGSAGVSHPMSRKKAALLGLLYGMGEAAKGSQNPGLARVLAGGATGATIGAVKPKAIQEWRRRMEVEDAQGELGQQQKLERGQAEIEESKAQTEQRKVAPAIAQAEVERKARYDQERLKIQQDAAAGRISTAEATRKLTEQRLQQDREQKELDRVARKEIAAEANVSRETVAGMRSTGSGGTGSGKREAKIREADTLRGEADALDANATALEEHITKLKDGLAAVEADTSPDTRFTVVDGKTIQNPDYKRKLDSFKSQLKELRTAQATQRKEARTIRAKAAAARAAGEAVPETSSTPRRGAVKPAKDGKYHYTLEQIKARSEAEGANYEQVLKKLRGDSRVVIDE